MNSIPQKKKQLQVAKIQYPLIEQEEWYQTLISDARAIIVEAYFTSNWALIEGYWELGKRIFEDKPKFDAIGLKNSEIVSRVSQSIKKSPRTVQRAIQFYKKYPDLGLLPEGKNTSWHRIVNKYLPETVSKAELRRCDICGGDLEASCHTEGNGKP